MLSIAQDLREEIFEKDEKIREISILLDIEESLNLDLNCSINNLKEEIVCIKKENEEMYVPTTVVNAAPPLGQVEKYYSSVYDRIFLPAYYMTTTNYFWESNLFEVAGNKLAYSVRTKSFDPSSAERLAHENGLMIINDMIKKKVIIEPAKDD